MALMLTELCFTHSDGVGGLVSREDMRLFSV